MNTTIKLSVATALAFGAVAAHASIAVPSGGSSDAILFAEVLNSSGTVVASYAGDTGVSLSTLAAGLSGTQVVLGGTANLNALFAADVSGDTLEWAIQGGQYTGAASTTNFGTKGNAQFITTTAGNATTSLAGDNTGNFAKWAQLSVDVGTINGNIGGAATSIEGTSAAAAGVWDVVSATAGSAVTENWYKNGPSTANVLGGTENLYYVTGNGTLSTAKVSFTNVGTASLSASGLTLTGASSPPPVPLPPAVWLLGSGLLGLAGVARRKSKV
jgi:hypothetical protein